MLTVIPDPSGRDDVAAGGLSAGASLIDEIVREGAPRMLAQALQAEVDAYIAQFADERDERDHRLVARNGHHEPRQVLTGAGAMKVRAPRVNDKRVDPVTGEHKLCLLVMIGVHADGSRRWRAGVLGRTA